MFKIAADFKPTKDQHKAIHHLSSGIRDGVKAQVLLGVTGSGKTFTMANVIQKTARPALIISHNKTLAGQLYQEMRDFFPQNAVSYFVSYYDFYQPEAYLPTTDTYIEKEAQINELIDKLRLKTTSNIMTREDVIVVASVSCIYNIGSPGEYSKFVLNVGKGIRMSVANIASRLVELQYDRSEFDFKRGTFRIRGSQIDIYPAYDDVGIRVITGDETIQTVSTFDPLTGRLYKQDGEEMFIYPAKHFLSDRNQLDPVEKAIRHDLMIEYKAHKKRGKLLEAERLLKKVNYDLEMIKEVGYINGIENYSRYFENRKIGAPPFTLLDYFHHAYGDQWSMFIDESHMTVPQIRGMHRGDQARKQTLVDYGFRLRAAFDNRPLRFDEFDRASTQTIYVSATPNEWEIKRAQKNIIEQLVRPTGIVDPKIIVRPAASEVTDVVAEIKLRVKKKQRVLVTTLTKRIAEDLTTYLVEQGIAAQYLHSDIKTLERAQILHKLRTRDCDVLVGINLLREGLDLPEVTLVAILDAGNEGFLRSKTALIQTMGRAARNIEGVVIIYTDVMTQSLKAAIDEIKRRRHYQLEYNKKNRITPKSISKKIKESIVTLAEPNNIPLATMTDRMVSAALNTIKSDEMTPFDRKKTIKRLTSRMKRAAVEMEFELAIAIREKVRELETYDR